MKAPRRCHVPAGVAWTMDEDDDGATRVFVAPLPQGPVTVLAGIAALIWCVALDDGVGTVAERVSRAADEPIAKVQDEVGAFLSDLRARGLLVVLG